MPLLSIDTNVRLEASKADEFVKSASKLVAEILGKPERYVMVKLEANPHMIFDGSIEPLIYAELKSIGLPEDQTKEYSKKLTALFNEKTDVKADRIYIEFANAERHMWGWNGATF